MDQQELSDEQIIERSKQNPKEIYSCVDGRIVINGLIFKNKEEMHGMMKIYAKFNKLKNFFKLK